MGRMALGTVIGLLLAAACAAVTNTDQADASLPGCIELDARRSADSVAVIWHPAECGEWEEGVPIIRITKGWAPLSHCDVLMAVPMDARGPIMVETRNCESVSRAEPEAP